MRIGPADIADPRLTIPSFGQRLSSIRHKALPNTAPYETGSDDQCAMPEWRPVIVIPRSDTFAFTRQSCVICLLV